MEAQATPGNPREEREDALRAGKGVRWGSTSQAVGTEA